MDETDIQRLAVQSTARFPHGDTEFDKSSDGRYWQILGWCPDDVILRLRIAHSSIEDVIDHFIAEVKVAAPNDASIRSDDGFKVVGEFDLSLYEIIDVGFDGMKQQPEEFSLDDFPEVWSEEFEALVCYWGRILLLMDLGETAASASAAEQRRR